MFIYTISDIIGAAIFGLLLLLGLCYAGLVVFYTLKRKWRNRK